jgi:predicted AAA+ superfamily ATPase
MLPTDQPVIERQRREFRPHTPEYREALETCLMHELVCYRDYVSGEPLAYWRSTSGFEVDFLIGDHTAIEVKAAVNVSARDLKPLQALAEERRFKHLVCVSLESRPRRVGGIEILPWQEFFERLWSGDFR